MATVVLIVSFFGFLISIVLLTFAYYKTKRALVVLQQSGYDNKRFFKYFKTGYKDTFPLNEVALLISGFIAYYVNIYVGLILVIFFAYYNMKFMYKVVTRYTEKKQLVLTSRVKRLLVTFVILNILLLVLTILIFKVHAIYMYLIIYAFLVYPTMLLANIINVPIEKYVKNYYIKQAKQTLSQRDDLLVIGITGSYGKTSIKNIIGSILSESEPTLITPESFNTPMGLTITVNNHLDTFHSNFVAEMGAYYKGEINELAMLVKPTVGIVSSVGPQHLETFGSIETVLNTKMELIEALPSDGLGIINIDNEYIKSYKIKNNCQIKTYSLIDETADMYAKDINIIANKTTFTINYQNKEYLITTKLLGKHNVENILAALLVCEYKNLDINKVVKAIFKLKPVSHRLEYKYVDSKLSIIDDAFNSNESGIKEAINVLASFSDKEQYIITPGLIDLGKDSERIHHEIAKYMEERIKNIYIVGEYNKKYFQEAFTRKDIKYFDNFIDAYQDVVKQDNEKVVLLANDLPDKFR